MSKEPLSDPPAPRYTAKMPPPAFAELDFTTTVFSPSFNQRLISTSFPPSPDRSVSAIVPLIQTSTVCPALPLSSGNYNFQHTRFHPLANASGRSASAVVRE